MSVNVKYSYPNNPEYEYKAFLEVINMEEDKKYSLLYQNGFIIKGLQSSLKKDLKNPEGIYSYKFGQTLQDVNPYGNRYQCECGLLQERYHINEICPKCHKPVRHVGDDLDICAWIVIKDKTTSIIHPNLFKSLQSYIGKNILDHMIGYVEKKDENGHKIIEENPEKPEGEPYFGIGLIEFKEKFEEIMQYYYKSQKKDKFNHLMENKDKIFINDINVFTSVLRPFEVSSDKFIFEGTNKYYNMMTKIVAILNDEYVRSVYKKKTTNQLLYDLNQKYQELYAELENILNGKKGCFNLN